MHGDEVYQVLHQIGATSLHHANSVTTSSTFLEQGGLASRGFVEDHGLRQTEQGSDALDKRYGIWHRIFLDHVDIHQRGGRVKGPNQYGPVLFVLDLNILLQLPTGSDILVTKENPIHWRDNQKPEDRYYQSADELAANICFGNFNKMLVIQTPSGMVEFPNRPVQIALDNPQKQVSCGEDAYTHAYNRLQQAARAGKGHAKIERHDCRGDCICIEKYARYSHQQMDFWFT